MTDHDGDRPPRTTASAAARQRRTKETTIDVDVALDGTGAVEVETGIPFFDHMLSSSAVTAGWRLTWLSHLHGIYRNCAWFLHQRFIGIRPMLDFAAHQEEEQDRKHGVHYQKLRKLNQALPADTILE